MISIIVPNYNHKKFLPQRLNTIFNQTFQDFEVILLDDCSTDDSWEYLKEYEHHPKVSHCIRNEINSGSPFKQWKKGLELAKYDWIWIAESDDCSDLSFLDKMVFNIETSLSLIFCKSDYINEFGSRPQNDLIDYLDKNFKLDDVGFVKKGVEFIREFLLFKNYILNSSSVLFRKPKYFPEVVLEMKFCGDWYFWIFILSSGSIKYLPNPLNKFRFHHRTTRGFIGLKNEEMRFLEFFKCINFGLYTAKEKTLNVFADNQFEDLVKEYFKIRMKLGRKNLRTIIPKIPFFVYPIYYRYYLTSLFGVKF